MVDTDVKACGDIIDDYNKIKKYEQDVFARPDAKDYINQIIQKNKEQIESCEVRKIELWNDGSYFASGTYAAMAAEEMGIIPPNPSPWDNTVMTDGSDRDPYAPAQFMAGWYYGIAQEDKRDNLLKCYKTDVDLTNTLYDAMEAYIDGDKATGDAKIGETKALYRKAFSGCGNLADDMSEWAQKVDDLAKIADWSTIAQKIYQDNKAVVDMDVKNELLEWEERVFFNSGIFAGQLGKIFIDNAPAFKLSTSERDAMVPAYFAAGWLDAITYENKQEYIVKCY